MIKLIYKIKAETMTTQKLYQELNKFSGLQLYVNGVWCEVLLGGQIVLSRRNHCLKFNRDESFLRKTLYTIKAFELADRKRVKKSLIWSGRIK